MGRSPGRVPLSVAKAPAYYSLYNVFWVPMNSQLYVDEPVISWTHFHREIGAQRSASSFDSVFAERINHAGWEEPTTAARDSPYPFPLMYLHVS